MITWVPDAKLAVLYVAVPELPRVPDPRTVVPSLKATVPVGTPMPIAGTTIAVKVIFAPKLAVGANDATVVVVATIATVTVIALDTDGAKSASPLYCTVMESAPMGSAVANVATPEMFSVVVPSVVVPNRNATVPVGVVGAPVGQDTVAVSVKACPGNTVANEDATVVVVESFETTIDIGLDTDGAKLASPGYCAVIESVPTGKAVVSVATPQAFSVAVPTVVVPDRNATAPVGIVAVTLGPATVAVKVTD